MEDSNHTTIKKLKRKLLHLANLLKKSMLELPLVVGDILRKLKYCYILIELVLITYIMKAYRRQDVLEILVTLICIRFKKYWLQS